SAKEVHVLGPHREHLLVISTERYKMALGQSDAAIASIGPNSGELVNDGIRVSAQNLRHRAIIFPMKLSASRLTTNSPVAENGAKCWALDAWKGRSDGW